MKSSGLGGATQNRAQLPGSKLCVDAEPVRLEGFLEKTLHTLALKEMVFPSEEDQDFRH